MREDLLKKMDRLLKGMGGTYSLQDILDDVDNGRMQSFAHGDTWAVTEVIDFPGARVVHVVAVVGDMDAIGELDEQIQEFGRSISAKFIRTFGRVGFRAKAAERGWKETHSVFVKEL